jgi:hypothetical protein
MESLSGASVEITPHKATYRNTGFRASKGAKNA